MLKLKQLQYTSGRLAKEAILRTLTGMELQVFKYALDPYKVYHIKQVGEIDWDNLGEPNGQLFSALDWLLNNQLLPAERMNVIDKHANEYGDLIRAVVAKNLDCGVAATLVNKVWKNSVPQFHVQKAKDVSLTHVTFPRYAQIKYNGVRLLMFINESTVHFRTRNGNFVPLPSIERLILSKPWHPQFIDTVIDCEVVVASGKDEIDRTSISGLINSAMHGGSIYEDRLQFWAFDTLPRNEFDQCRCSLTYDVRYAVLTAQLEMLKLDYFKLSPHRLVHNVTEVEQYYKEVITEGYEGLILKAPQHKYTYKRSPDWVKMKEVKTVDLICIGVIEGEGKYEGMIGALECTGEIDGNIVNVSVGSGLTDVDRAREPDYYIAETIEVKYNTVMHTASGIDSTLFLPRFVCVRFDK